jgi:hypothetical protein
MPVALQAFFNTSVTASSLSIDGTSTTGTISINGISNSDAVGMSNGGNPITGTIFEVGIWSSDKSANYATMNSNQHTYWGF